MSNVFSKRIQTILPFQSLLTQSIAAASVMLSISLALYVFAWMPKQNAKQRQAIAYLTDMQEQIERLSIATSSAQLEAAEQEATELKNKFYPNQKNARETITGFVEHIAEKDFKVEYLPLGVAQSPSAAELSELQSEIAIDRPRNKRNKETAPQALPLADFLKQLHSSAHTHDIARLQVQADIDGIQNVTIALSTPYLKQDEKAAE